MANGGYWATLDEWRRVEAPLLEIDSVLEQFARELGVRVTKNHKDWPERSIAWRNSIHYLVQLFLADDERLTFNLWLCASQDRWLNRYWKQQYLVQGKPVAEFKDALPSLLRQGRVWLQSLSARDLELATNLDIL